MPLRATKLDRQRKLEKFHPKIISIISHIECKLNSQKLKSTVLEYTIYNAYIMHFAFRTKEILILCICVSFFVYLGKYSNFYIPRSIICQGKWLRSCKQSHSRYIHCTPKAEAFSSFVGFFFCTCMHP